jgi:hypothetical protein
MIYNLSKFISDGTPITPITNGVNSSSPQEGVLLLQTGGQDPSRGLKVDFVAQFLAKFSDQTISYEQIHIIDDFLKNRFDVTLPEVTINSITYPEITVAQIIPLAVPGYVGADINGLTQWSVNYQISLKE